MNNRNPYHNYGDLQGIMNKIIEVNDMWNSKDYELLASGHKKSNFYLPNYKKHHSTFACKTVYTTDEITGERKKVFTDFLWIPFEYEVSAISYFREEQAKFSKKGKLRQRKKGNPQLIQGDTPDTFKWKYEEYKSVYEKISDDIQQYFELFNEYRQIWCSFTNSKYNNQRSVIVCDIDKAT